MKHQPAAATTAMSSPPWALEYPLTSLQRKRLPEQLSASALHLASFSEYIEGAFDIHALYTSIGTHIHNYDQEYRYIISTLDTYTRLQALNLLHLISPILYYNLIHNGILHTNILYYNYTITNFVYIHIYIGPVYSSVHLCTHSAVLKYNVMYILYGTCVQFCATCSQQYLKACVLALQIVIDIHIRP